MLDRVAYQGLRLLRPEPAHDLGKWAMKKKMGAPGPWEIKGQVTALFGKSLANPLGLAAGFDKNAELVDVIENYGFGWLEVGSVTFRGGPGNPKPRMFRIDQNDVMNRMGLNGLPALLVAQRLNKTRSTHYGVNIAKTHDPEIMGDKAIEDMVMAFNVLKGYGFYTVINISCPNTREGRTFEDTGALRDLLHAITRAGLVKPLLLKLSPTLTKEKLYEIVGIGEANHVSGYVACNTMPFEHPKYGKGGASGTKVLAAGVDTVMQLREYTQRPIIACGGIFSGSEMYAYYRAGATVYQAYNGFVRGPNAGPRFAHRVNEQFQVMKMHAGMLGSPVTPTRRHE